MREKKRRKELKKEKSELKKVNGCKAQSSIQSDSEAFDKP